VVAVVAVGALLRVSGTARDTDGQFLLRVVVTVCQPALVFLSVSRIVVTPGLAVFAVVVPAMAALGSLAGRLVGRGRAFTGTQFPVLLIACMMVNSGFVLPWAQVLFGDDGVARVALADAVSSVVTFSWAYWTAARGNPDRSDGALPVGRLLTSPPLYGVAAGLVVNLTGTTVPGTVVGLLTPVASATTVLIALGTGVLLTLPRRAELAAAATVVGTRLATGLAVSTALVLVLDPPGVDRALLFLLAVAPVAFMTVTFAALEKLDVRMAAAALSLSLLASLLLSPVVAVVLR
jgi:malate permease and related proteins